MAEIDQCKRLLADRQTEAEMAQAGHLATIKDLQKLIEEKDRRLNEFGVKAKLS